MQTYRIVIDKKTHDFTAEQIHSLIDDLHSSVADFRNAQTTPEERLLILDWWYELGVQNQFHAMLVASGLRDMGV